MPITETKKRQLYENLQNPHATGGVLALFSSVDAPTPTEQAGIRDKLVDRSYASLVTHIESFFLTNDGQLSESTKAEDVQGLAGVLYECRQVAQTVLDRSDEVRNCVTLSLRYAETLEALQPLKLAYRAVSGLAQSPDQETAEQEAREAYHTEFVAYFNALHKVVAILTGYATAFVSMQADEQGTREQVAGLGQQRTALISERLQAQKELDNKLRDMNAIQEGRNPRYDELNRRIAATIDEQSRASRKVEDIGGEIERTKSEIGGEDKHTGLWKRVHEAQQEKAKYQFLMGSNSGRIAKLREKQEQSQYAARLYREGRLAPRRFAGAKRKIGLQWYDELDMTNPKLISNEEAAKCDAAATAVDREMQTVLAQNTGYNTNLARAHADEAHWRGEIEGRLGLITDTVRDRLTGRRQELRELGQRLKALEQERETTPSQVTVADALPQLSLEVTVLTDRLTQINTTIEDHEQNIGLLRSLINAPNVLDRDPYQKLKLARASLDAASDEGLLGTIYKDVAPEAEKLLPAAPQEATQLGLILQSIEQGRIADRQQSQQFMGGVLMTLASAVEKMGQGGMIAPQGYALAGGAPMALPAPIDVESCTYHPRTGLAVSKGNKKWLVGVIKENLYPDLERKGIDPNGLLGKVLNGQLDGVLLTLFDKFTSSDERAKLVSLDLAVREVHGG